MIEQGTVDEQVLLARLRVGEDAAFGELFELHAVAVRRLARSLAADTSEAEDITAETFFRVLQALRRGAGPRDHVRAYLLTVARRVSWEWHGARRDVPVSDDELTNRVASGMDTHARTAEHTLITTAFTSLPERWRTVLWQTEVEGEQPAMVATHFGLSANATAALARRARQGLRAAYLQAHLSVSRSSNGCRTIVEKLGGYTAGSVTGAEARRIQDHLVGCSSCRSTHDELRDVCSSLRANAGAVLLLAPASGAGLTHAVSSVLSTLRGLLTGSKLKIGLALASTAAAGAVGIAAGPLMLGQTPTEISGLPGGPGLTMVDPDRPSTPPAAVTAGVGNLVAPGRHPASGARRVPGVPPVAGPAKPRADAPAAGRPDAGHVVDGGAPAARGDFGGSPGASFGASPPGASVTPREDLVHGSTAATSTRSCSPAGSSAMSAGPTGRPSPATMSSAPKKRIRSSGGHRESPGRAPTARDDMASPGPADGSAGRTGSAPAAVLPATAFDPSYG
jgi:RNA polymerase sigma factor (sigma-70 family)